MKLVAAAVCMLVAPALATAHEVNQAPVPKAQFVAQGNAVCASTGAEIERVFSAGFPLLAESTPAFFGRLAPPARARADQLAALGRPTGDAAAERLVALAALTAADFERASTDQAFAVRLFSAEGGANLLRFERRAKAYGLNKCVLPDDEEGDDRPPVDRSRFSPAKRAFIAQADAICRRTLARDRPVERRYLRTFPPTLASWAQALPRFAANGRLEVAGLRDLTPPAADRARINAFLRVEAAQIAGLERIARLAAAGRPAVVERQLGRLFERGEEVSARAQQYGFRVCGNEED